MIGIGFLCHAENDNVNQMARDLADGFGEIGIEYHLVDTREPEAGRILLQHLAEASDQPFLCCYNNIGLPTDRESPILKLLNDFEIPVLSWYLDHPVINAADFKVRLNRHLIVQNAPAHIQFLESQPVHGKKPLSMLPHAANISNDFHWDSEKDIPCLLIGTVKGPADHQRALWLEQYGETVNRNLNQAVELYLSGGQKDLLSLLHAAIGKDQFEALPWQGLQSYCLVLDRYFRDRLKQILAQHCLDVGGMVVGPGFRDLVQGGKPEQLPGAVTADQVPVLMARAKMTMAAVPEYYQSHERMFLSAANSSTIVTGQQDFPGTWLDDGVIKLNYQKPADNVDRLQDALMDDKTLQEKAKRAYHATRERHQYKHRAHSIQQLIRSHLIPPHQS